MNPFRRFRGGGALNAVWPKRTSGVLVIAGLISILSCSRTGRGGVAGGEPTVDYALTVNVCRLVEKKDLELMLGREYLDGSNKADYDAIINEQLGAPQGAYSDLPFPDLPGAGTCFFGSRENPVRHREVLGVVQIYAQEVWKKATQGRKELAVVQGLNATAVWDGRGQRLLVLKASKILALSLHKELHESDTEIRARAIRLASKPLRRLDGSG